MLAKGSCTYSNGRTNLCLMDDDKSSCEQITEFLNCKQDTASTISGVVLI